MFWGGGEVVGIAVDNGDCHLPRGVHDVMDWNNLSHAVRKSGTSTHNTECVLCLCNTLRVLMHACACVCFVHSRLHNGVDPPV